MNDNKPHKGVIYGVKMHTSFGDILVGLYAHPEKGRMVLRFTSLIVREEGEEYETLNSRYTLRESDLVTENSLKHTRGYLPTSL